MRLGKRGPRGLTGKTGETGATGLTGAIGPSGNMADVWGHIETINREMGEVKTDCVWLKEKLNSIETKLWFLVSGVLITIAIEILRIGIG